VGVGLAGEAVPIGETGRHSEDGASRLPVTSCPPILTNGI
jgi:hypothetical protein